MLKDGNFQLVRSYERNGERVRYFSLERGDWEEIPAAMVDWDATEKARIADEKADAALVKKVQAQEQARQVVSVVDVDASLQVGQGVFLPTGEGMFAVTGKTVTPLEQVGAQTSDATRSACWRRLFLRYPLFLASVMWKFPARPPRFAYRSPPGHRNFICGKWRPIRIIPLPSGKAAGLALMGRKCSWCAPR